MKRVHVDDVKPDEVDPGLRVLTGPLGTTDAVINRYDTPPGGQDGGGYHTHHDQRGVLRPLGRRHVRDRRRRRRGRPGRSRPHRSGRLPARFNAGDGPLALLALGAPPQSLGVEDVRQCTACGEGFHHHCPSFGARGIDPDDPARRVSSPECGAGARRIGRPD